MTNTDAALNDILSTVVDHLKTKYGYGAVGTGTTEPSAGDTALENEVLRKALRGVQVIGGNKVLFTLYIDELEANGYDLSEMAIFDADSDGTMLCRNTFLAFTKTSDIEVWFEVEETVEVTQ